MFVDTANIQISSGKGGDGAVAFHREKYINAGGPDGGDGGRGGNVVFIADSNLNTLMDFRYKRKYEAENGENGGTNKCSGKSAPDLIIKVPFGTLIKDAQSGLIIKDMSDELPFIAARGGNGGWGNQHFATPRRQIPRFSKPGQPGETKNILLELKLIADVGLIGFPNVGKSTLLSVVSSARPKIANYHFTTLTPNLGVVQAYEESSFVIADIPGIIEGAAKGAGLGIDFLKHVERCRLLVHVVDISGCEGRDPIEDFKKLNEELKGYSEKLACLPQIIAANKSDIANDDIAEQFKKEMQKNNLPVFFISAATKEGIMPLIAKIIKTLEQLPKVKVFNPEFVPTSKESTVKDKRFTVEVHDGVYYVEGEWLAKIMASVRFDDYESLQFFQRVLKNNGIISKLEQMGINQGDYVSIYDYEFEYIK